jgi:hypothetical protein
MLGAAVEVEPGARLERVDGDVEPALVGEVVALGVDHHDAGLPGQCRQRQVLDDGQREAARLARPWRPDDQQRRAQDVVVDAEVLGHDGVGVRVLDGATEPDLARREVVPRDPRHREVVQRRRVRERRRAVAHDLVGQLGQRRGVLGPGVERPGDAGGVDVGQPAVLDQPVHGDGGVGMVVAQHVPRGVAAASSSDRHGVSYAFFRR